MKYKSKRIGETDKDLVFALCKKFTLQVCVITGWQMPESKEYVMTFEDQLFKLLTDHWQDVNFDELEYAVRTYHKQFKDWGKSINLSLIESCLIAYYDTRQSMSEMEERLRIGELPAGGPTKNVWASPPLYQYEAVTMTTTEVGFVLEQKYVKTDWSKHWRDILEAAQYGYLSQIFITACVFDWLEDRKEIVLDKSQKWAVMQECREKYMSDVDLLRTTGKMKHATAIDILRRLSLNTWFKDEELRTRLSNMSKILIVKRHALKVVKDLPPLPNETSHIAQAGNDSPVTENPTVQETT